MEKNKIIAKLFLLTALVSTALTGFGQYNSRPTRSRFYNSKSSTFSVRAGDSLIYRVSCPGQQSELLVVVKSFGNTIAFSYSDSAKLAAGDINIQSVAVKNAIIYDTLPSANSKNYTDTSVLWLSKKSYTDLAAAKETVMNLGGGKESFKRRRVSTLKLKYKGQDKIVTVFNVENDDSNAKRRFSVLNDENNPLIVDMNLGWTLTLKEVR